MKDERAPGKRGQAAMSDVHLSPGLHAEQVEHLRLIHAFALADFCETAQIGSGRTRLRLPACTFVQGV
jgi:hypothetical protein